jgi:hypothetical protein
MGIATESYIQFLESIPQGQRLNILELGTQDIVDESVKIALRKSISDTYYNNSGLFKFYLNELGYNVISIDIMGDRGSIPVNLCEDIDVWNLGQFDIVTNYGTTEHVDNQYMCWKNMHKSLKIGGVMINEIPKIGNWPGHCEFYYDLKFFKEFEKIGYEIIYSKDHMHPGNGALIAVSLKKVEDIEFFTDEKAFNDLVHIVSQSSISIDQYWKDKV